VTGPTKYDESKAARDAILFQMADKKLCRKIIAEDPALQEVIKLGIANKQAAKVADRFKTKPEQEAPKTRIAALEEQVRALAKSASPGGGKKKTSCTTCTRPTHGEGKCRALTATCHVCNKVGHYKGSKACTKSGKGKASVNAVESDTEQGDKDSEAESVGRVVEEQVRASQTDQVKEDLAKVEMIMIDHARQAPAKNVRLLVDSGVKKTLINEEIWKKMQKKAGGKNLQLKKCKTRFRPYGTKEYLPIMGRSKCKMQDARCHHTLHGVRGEGRGTTPAGLGGPSEVGHHPDEHEGGWPEGGHCGQARGCKEAATSQHRDSIWGPDTAGDRSGRWRSSWASSRTCSQAWAGPMWSRCTSRWTPQSSQSSRKGGPLLSTMWTG
jgi:hypothetical protein